MSAAGAALYGFSPDFDMEEPFQMDDTYFPCEAAFIILLSSLQETLIVNTLAERLNIRIEMPVSVSAV